MVLNEGIRPLLISLHRGKNILLCFWVNVTSCTHEACWIEQGWGCLFNFSPALPPKSSQWHNGSSLLHFVLLAALRWRLDWESVAHGRATKWTSWLIWVWISWTLVLALWLLYQVACRVPVWETAGEHRGPWVWQQGPWPKSFVQIEDLQRTHCSVPPWRVPSWRKGKTQHTFIYVLCLSSVFPCWDSPGVLCSVLGLTI